MTRGTSILSALALLVGGLMYAGSAPAGADVYTPPGGVKLSNPAGSRATKYAIEDHIIRSIYSAPRNTRIKIMSWNIRSRRASEALVRAHRRGVSVQVIMERINAYEREPDETNPIPASPEENPDWWWMKREFRRGNDARKPGFRSWAKLCNRSCRGTGPMAHTKMFVFEKVYKSKYVVMYGSNNLTSAATSAQWNDLFTSVGRSKMYAFALRRFHEMSRDEPMGNPWRVRSFTGVHFGFFPWKGAGAVGDPVKRVFNQVKCYGATGTTGNNGRTVIRVAQTAIAGDRGVRLAKAIRGLWDRGCDVKIVYGLINNESLAVFRGRGGRGPMPVRQIAQDFDGDFIYDRYLHQKSMTISGVYGADTSASYVWNGSANWVGYTLSSDEIFTRINSARLVRQYTNFVNSKYANPPRSARGQLPAAYARLAGIDPYAKFEIH